MRSAISTASSRSWVTNRIVFLVRRVDVEQFGLQRLARLRVERAERLVHQQHGGVDGQRAGDADALLHAAGKLMRAAVAANP